MFLWVSGAGREDMYFPLTPRCPFNVSRRFGETFVSFLLHATFLFGLLSNPTNLGNLFLRNVGSHSTDCTVNVPDDRVRHSTLLCPHVYFAVPIFNILRMYRPSVCTSHSVSAVNTTTLPALC
jgi:hypothetical protein